MPYFLVASMPIQLTDAARSKLDAILTRYPNKMAALAARAAHRPGGPGPLTPEVQQLIADYPELPIAHIYGVVTFYTMFHPEAGGQERVMISMHACRACCAAATTSASRRAQ